MPRKLFAFAFYLSLAFFTYLLLKDGGTPHFLQKLIRFNFEFEYSDKLIHIAIFSWLMFVLNIAYPAAKRNSACLLLYGLLIEITQGLFTETRTFDLLDFVADGIGILLGLWLSQSKNIHKILKLKN